jgi:hypothetical protein
MGDDVGAISVDARANQVGRRLPLVPMPGLTRGSQFLFGRVIHVFD